MYISCERDISSSSATGYDRSPGRNTTLSARRSLVIAPLQSSYPEGSKPPTPQKRLHSSQYQHSPGSSCSASPSHLESLEPRFFSPNACLEIGEKEKIALAYSKGHTSSPHSLRDRNCLSLAPIAPRRMSGTNLKEMSGSHGKGSAMVPPRDAASSATSLPDRGSSDKLVGLRVPPGTPGRDARSGSPLGPSASPRGLSGPALGPPSRHQDRLSTLSKSPTASTSNIPRSPSLSRSPTVHRDMSFLALNSLPSSPAHNLTPTLLSQSKRSHSSSQLSHQQQQPPLSPFSPHPLHATLPPGTPYHTSPASRPVSPPLSRPFSPPLRTHHHPSDAHHHHPNLLTPILLIGMLLALLSLNVILPQYNLPWLLLPTNGTPVFSTWLEFSTVLLFLLALVLVMRFALGSFFLSVRLPASLTWWSAFSSASGPFFSRGALSSLSGRGGFPFRSTGTVLYRRFSNNGSNGSGNGSFGDGGVWTRPLLPTVRMTVHRNERSGGANNNNSNSKDGAPPLPLHSSSSSGGDLATVVVSRVPSGGTMTERRVSSSSVGEGGSLPATPRGGIGLPSSPLGPGQVSSVTSSSGRGYDTGVHTYGNGDRYEGELKNGKSWGFGVYYFAMAGRYEGEWEDNKYQGHGMETWSRGNRYRGQYRGGYRDGYGVYRFYTGDVYAGEWRKGQSFGVGTQTCVDGSRYYGQFQWGVKHGYGKYHFSGRNGDVYIGEYFGDKMHGYGIYIFENGHKYEGSWHEGRKQGLGLYTFRNGDSRGGFWDRGELAMRVSSHDRTPVESPVSGGSPVDHNRMMQAVQEARNVAEKVANLPKVDDRITRAVNQTNRAAIAARVAAVKAAQIVSI